MIYKDSISVVIPTCDRPVEYLCKAVFSVINQSLMPSEIIIVDNGIVGADLTGLPEDRITLLRLPPRVGPSRARNFGAAMAKNTYLAFLDDDDWWDVDFLTNAMSMMQVEKARLVYGRKDVYRDGITMRYKCPEASTLAVPVLLRRNPGTGGINLLIEKKLFWFVGGFDEVLKTSEDKALAIEVLLSGEKIAVAPEAVAIMRTHDGARARQAHILKLIFLWKYRHLLGVGGIMANIVRVFWYLTLDKLRHYIGRSK